MNVKKIILAATTLIMATTLPNSFADSNQVTGIQTEKVYVSEWSEGFADLLTPLRN